MKRLISLCCLYTSLCFSENKLLFQEEGVELFYKTICLGNSICIIEDCVRVAKSDPEKINEMLDAMQMQCDECKAALHGIFSRE